MLCLTDVRGRHGCVEYFPSDEQVDPADTILEADGKPFGSVDDLVDGAGGQAAGRHRRAADRPSGRRASMTVTVELSASPDEPGRTIVGFQPFDTRVVNLPFEVDIEHRRHRWPVGRPGVHAGADRPAVAGPAHRRPRRGGDRHDRPRRLGRRDRRVGAEGVRGAPERCRRVPRPGVAVGAERPRADADADRCGPWRGRDHPGGDARRGAGGAREARRRPARAGRRCADAAASPTSPIARSTPSPTRIATISRAGTRSVAAWPCRLPVPIRRRRRRSPTPRSAPAVADSIRTRSSDFLRMVAAELGRLQERERFLERELRTAQTNPDLDNVRFDDATLTRLLGEETARVLGDGSRGGHRDPREGRTERGAPAERGERRGVAHARGGRGRGVATPVRRRRPMPRPSWRWPSSRAVRWSTRRGRIASGC